jgi:glycosyltransferase involved in cell wall biosynthesis
VIPTIRDRFSSKKSIRMLSILVAAYNEESTIEIALIRLREVLKELAFESEIIVVESNSTDMTRAILHSIRENLKLKIFFQDAPAGKGNAIRTAMSQMSGDVFLIYDADFEYDPTDIPKLLARISDGTTSFVLGTRHQKGRPMRVMPDHVVRSYLMNAMHKIFTGLINFTFRVSLTDPFTMYKVFRSEVFENVSLVSNRFDLDWELVAKAIRRGSVPIEIPVNYKSRSFSEGKKVRFFRDPMTWLIALIRFKFGKIREDGSND